MSEAPNSINKKELTFIKTKIPNLDENKLKSLEARLIGPSSDGNMPADLEPLMEIDVEQIKSKFSSRSENNTMNAMNESQKEGLEKEKGVQLQYGALSTQKSFPVQQKAENNLNNSLNILEGTNNNNNSNKSIQLQQSTKKKSTPKKAEKKTKISGNLQIDFLSTKRARNETNSAQHSNINLNSQGNNLNNKDDSDKEQIQQINYENINSDKAHTEYQIVNIPMNINSSDNNLLDDAIEFSSKNVINKTSFFKTKENSAITTMPKTNLVMNNSYITSNINQSKPNKSDVKINEYFNKVQSADKKISKENSNNINTAGGFSLNNLNHLQTPESNFRVVKQLQEDADRISKECVEIKKVLSEKEKDNEKMKNILEEHEDSIKNLTAVNKQQDHLINISKFSLAKYLKELEDMKRTNKKKWVNEQEFRLGKIIVSRVGNKSMEMWDQGEEITKLQYRYRAIEKEKDELERQKRNLANYLRKRSTNIEVSDHNTENELNDMKELINFKLNSYQREEIEIKEKLEKLEIEKTLVAIESKRLREEETSRYASITSKEKFPILANRYLILSLLGKGGYSEVYKAYDLENNIEVACKIHQLNNQWSDSIKENYIRHTIRENQIHKEICHSKIVRHYDTIEIDNNSFCTVLELCTGPDLHTYLKTQKTLQEKECRIIIGQILYGLEYMNKLQKRIIHYDLKPQNIIFNNMEVKISDFGLAKIMEDNADKIELTSQGVGTYWYLPPECFDTSRNPPGISSKVDIWSVGVILYELLYGIRPFGHTFTQDKILKEGVIINARKVDFPQKPLVSDECKDFIRKSLAYRQEERIDVFDALDHQFMKNSTKKAK